MSLTHELVFKSRTVLLCQSYTKLIVFHLYKNNVILLECNKDYIIKANFRPSIIRTKIQDRNIVLCCIIRKVFDKSKYVNEILKYTYIYQNVCYIKLYI